MELSLIEVEVPADENSTNEDASKCDVSVFARTCIGILFSFVPPFRFLNMLSSALLARKCNFSIFNILALCPNSFLHHLSTAMNITSTFMKKNSGDPMCNLLKKYLSLEILNSG